MMTLGGLVGLNVTGSICFIAEILQNYLDAETMFSIEVYLKTLHFLLIMGTKRIKILWSINKIYTHQVSLTFSSS